MQTTQEIYRQTILPLPDADKLEIASMILQNLTDKKADKKFSAIELLKKMPERTLFETSEKVDEFLREERDSWER